MNDQRIHELVRMAIEVEELESGGQGAPGLRLAGSGVLPRRMSRTHQAWWVAAGTALAAGLALAIALPVYLKPSSTKIVTNPPPRQPFVEPRALPIPANIVQVVTLPMCTPDLNKSYPVRSGFSMVSSGEPHGSAVVTIYPRVRGNAPCVQVWAHQWSENRCLGEVSAQEIRAAGTSSLCNVGNQTLVVALAGPRRVLPKTQAEAEGLAQCILGFPHECGGDMQCLSHIAMQCVDPNVSVKIETVASPR